jgi:hypothetical protein
VGRVGAKGLGEKRRCHRYSTARGDRGQQLRDWGLRVMQSAECRVRNECSPPHSAFCTPYSAFSRHSRGLGLGLGVGASVFVRVRPCSSVPVRVRPCHQSAPHKCGGDRAAGMLFSGLCGPRCVVLPGIPS